MDPEYPIRVVEEVVEQVTMDVVDRKDVEDFVDKVIIHVSVTRVSNRYEALTANLK